MSCQIIYPQTASPYFDTTQEPQRWSTIRRSVSEAWEGQGNLKQEANWFVLQHRRLPTTRRLSHTSLLGRDGLSYSYVLRLSFAHTADQSTIVRLVPLATQFIASLQHYEPEQWRWAQLQSGARNIHAKPRIQDRTHARPTHGRGIDSLWEQSADGQ